LNGLLVGLLFVRFYTSFGSGAGQEKAQRNICVLLSTGAEYVINTSEYEDIRARLEDLSKKTPPEASKAP
jgi:hypothetical protein